MSKVEEIIERIDEVKDRQNDFVWMLGVDSKLNIVRNKILEFGW